MSPFWPACPYVPEDRQANGSVRISDAFLRALWLRPEVAPVEESCASERALHAQLLKTPRELPTAARLARLSDADARDNYSVLAAFVGRLLAAPSAEEAYRAIFDGNKVEVAPLFIDLLVELILRNLLEGCDDAWQVRAAELLFLAQKVAIQQGAVMLADLQAVERHASGAAFGTLGKLLVDAKIKPRNVPLDVLNEDNKAGFLVRSGAHDMVLPFQRGSAGLAAFCRVLEKWIAHFCQLQVEIKPIAAIEEAQWAWHIGLDAQASALMNDLYEGRALDAARQHRLLALFEMRCQQPQRLQDRVRGRAIYLACAMTPEETLRIKPQNLLLNMPLAQ
ncbi:MAG: hypothetical protein JWP36_1776 [Paucimonas sp.]|nr:hypothetical protein [Paucimonas sp.]